MNRIVLFLLILFVSESVLQCPANQVYAKFRKQSKSYAYEESWKIMSGDTAVYESPELENDALYEAEACLPSSVHNQFILYVYDSYGDSWSAGSWLEIQGAYGQVFFKGYLIDSREEQFPLSLYTPIEKNAVWQFSNSFNSQWVDPSFDDSLWEGITLNSVTIASSGGVQYFRRRFTGLTNMAAYEARLCYRYGVVVYLNGYEVHRDNMPEGEILSSTPATGGYDTSSCRGFIRSAADVESADSLLAVELHFLQDSVQTVIDLNAFLSVYSSNSHSSLCYDYPYAITIHSENGYDADYAMNYNKMDSYSCYNAAVVMPTLEISVDPLIVPFVNTLRIYPYSSPSNCATKVQLTGAYDVTASYYPILLADGLTYNDKQWTEKNTIFNARGYKNYKVKILGANSGYVYVFELGLAMCNLGGVHEIKYQQATYQYYAHYQQVSILPIVDEFTGCSISPTLPMGLSFISTTCSIEGVAAVASASTRYTITTIMDSTTYTGFITIEIVACQGTMIEIERVYRGNSADEFFSIIEDGTNAVVFAVNQNGGQQDSTTIRNSICLTSSKYHVFVDGTSQYWMTSSFLFINAMLGVSDKERILRIRKDNHLNLQTSRAFNPLYAVSIRQNWKYRMGEIPPTWRTSDGSDWSEASLDSFPASTNRIQLYKKSFVLPSVAESAGFVLSLRYKYGCIVIMNGVEVFRNGVPEGEITTVTTPTNIYNEVFYRQVSLPVKTIPMNETNSVSFLQEGTNVITVALIAITDSMTESVFDAALRLMGDSEVSRIFDYSASYINISGGSTVAFDHSYYNYIYTTSCFDNSLQITFSNDRREWISSVVIQNHYYETGYDPAQFVIEAKNADTAEWIRIKEVTNMFFSFYAQERKVWLPNNRPFNQYRFVNINKNSLSNCAWRINRIDMYCDDMALQPPSLSYPESVVYKDIEIAEIYPSSTLYTDFAVAPPLPNGIHLDSISGEISGTATVQQAMTNYLISARQYNGNTVTASFAFKVDVCAGNSGLVTLTVRTDNYPENLSYEVFKGKGEGGSRVASLESFPRASTFHYSDFCLPNSLYTLVLKTTKNFGLNTPSGYMLSVDVSQLRFDMEQIPGSTETPVKVTSIFSTFIPFLMDYSTWKVLKSHAPSSWSTPEYNDDSWASMVAGDLGTADTITIYARKVFSLPDKNDYKVLNIRMKYNGGVIVFFNGIKVARFNMPEYYDDTTYGTVIHMTDVYSKFHIILGIVGARTDTNVIGFELHRAADTSSSTPFIFDVTGVFGVQDCSIVVDTFSKLDGSSPSYGALSDLFDLNPTTYANQPNAVGTNLHWVFENLEGSKFNRIGINPYYDRTGWGFSVYGRHVADADYSTVAELVEVSLLSRERYVVPTPISMAGYSEYNLQYDVAASYQVAISSFSFLYCQASGSGYCEGNGLYPPVAHGELSPGPCGEGFKGYSYRICTNGEFGEVISTTCQYKEPSNLSYNKDYNEFIIDLPARLDPPTYTNIITEFYLHENQMLPAGLFLDATTGVIHGTPTEKTALTEYTIFGRNPSTSTTSTTLFIQTRLGFCAAEGLFPKTDVGETAVYECSSQGAYVGSQRRSCFLGSSNGVWGKASGMCLSVLSIIIIVLVVVVSILIALFFIIRLSKRKAAGTVKGKKKVAPGSKKAIKQAPKVVKV